MAVSNEQIAHTAVGCPVRQPETPLRLFSECVGGLGTLLIIHTECYRLAAVGRLGRQKEGDFVPDYQPRAPPNIHNVAAVAHAHCGAILYGLRVVLEIVLFCPLDMIRSVEKTKTIGGHGRSFLFRFRRDTLPSSPCIRGP